MTKRTPLQTRVRERLPRAQPVKLEKAEFERIKQILLNSARNNPVER